MKLIVAVSEAGQAIAAAPNKDWWELRSKIFDLYSDMYPQFDGFDLTAGGYSDREEYPTITEIRGISGLDIYFVDEIKINEIEI